MLDTGGEMAGGAFVGFLARFSIALSAFPTPNAGGQAR